MSNAEGVHVDHFEGFREFLAQHTGRLSGLAYLLTGNHHAAEDLLQTALTKVAVRWPKVCRYERPEAYVRRVMLHEHISGWRRRKRLIERPVEHVPESGATDDSERTVLRVLLDRALRQLPARQRAVIVLRYYLDLTEARTAEELHCSVGTVKSQAHHALAKLRNTSPELADLLPNGSEVSV